MSFRDLERMLAERGVLVDHVSLHRWVRRFAPELERRVRPHLTPASRGRHADETCIRVGNAWRYLDRAVDGAGRTVDFPLSATRDAAVAKRFSARALGRGRVRAPSVVVTDRLASYRTALRELKRGGLFPGSTRHRRGRWLNSRGTRAYGGYSTCRRPTQQSPIFRSVPISAEWRPAKAASDRPAP